MKIITIASTRPEIIRLSLIIRKLDDIFKKNHFFIHTGQNFTKELHEQFFQELNIRKPDIQLNLNKLNGFKFGGYCLNEIEKILNTFNPSEDKILILGDVNGAFYSSYVAKKMGFKIYHMEAGNRCYDDKVPEEINRRAIDSFSFKLLTYTQRSRENLLIEGYKSKDIIVIGNPIGEVIRKFSKNKNKKKTKDIVVTLHRTENITNHEILNSITKQLNLIANNEILKISLHPKLEDMLNKWKDCKNNLLHKNIELFKPWSFIKFLELEQKSKLIISDSGTVPEECAIFKTPCILIRDSTERPELLEVNQMIVSGTRNIFENYKIIDKLKFDDIPKEYMTNTSDIIIKILSGCL